MSEDECICGNGDAAAKLVVDPMVLLNDAIYAVDCPRHCCAVVAMMGPDVEIVQLGDVVGAAGRFVTPTINPIGMATCWLFRQSDIEWRKPRANERA